MQFDSGSSWQDKAKQVLREGNIRHLVVEKEGKRIVDLPLTFVIIGALLAVWLVALLAVLALFLGYRISIENTEAGKDDDGDGPNAVHGALEAGKDAVDQAEDATKSAIDDAADAVSSAAESAADTAKSATESVADTARDAADAADSALDR